MVTCYIKEPIWKDRTIGVKPSKEDVLIGILYKGQDGKLKWPDRWLLTAEQLAKFPIKKYGKGIAVHIIPISVLETMPVYQPEK